LASFKSQQVFFSRHFIKLEENVKILAQEFVFPFLAARFWEKIVRSILLI
jgi:hypothetical protein